jgi:hypothetical protein
MKILSLTSFELSVISGLNPAIEKIGLEKVSNILLTPFCLSYLYTYFILRGIDAKILPKDKPWYLHKLFVEIFGSKEHIVGNLISAGAIFEDENFIKGEKLFDDEFSEYSPELNEVIDKEKHKGLYNYLINL